MPHAALPTTAAEHRTTSALIHQAIGMLRVAGIHRDLDGMASADGTQYDVPTALLLAHTGQRHAPELLRQSATRDQGRAVLALFHAHPEVEQAIGFLSEYIDTEGAIDADGITDYLEHLSWWTTWKNGVPGQPGATVPAVPDTDVFAVMRVAADHAAARATELENTPAPRAA